MRVMFKYLGTFNYESPVVYKQRFLLYADQGNNEANIVSISQHIYFVQFYKDLRSLCRTMSVCCELTESGIIMKDSFL
jgi:hypothetical protein